METSQDVLELLDEAQIKAKALETQILEHTDGQSGPEAQIDGFSDAARELQSMAVEAFTLFELQMQHHFKRGPFARKLRAKLVDAGFGDLADRVHHFYLAINVLKHGKGASYRELLSTPNLPFAVERDQDETQEPTPLVNVAAPGFFDGLAGTLREAHAFLENT